MRFIVIFFIITEYLDNILLLTSLEYLEISLCADFDKLAQLTNLRNLLLRADDQTPEMSVNDIRELVSLPHLKEFALASPLAGNQVKPIFANKNIDLTVQQN